MLSKKYDAKASEMKWSAYWTANKTYQYERGGSEVVYSIDTPPPTVSGKLHIGHIFSYSQAEMIARFKRMTGHRVFYPFGFDDNGLPTERLVEREKKVYAKDLPLKDFKEMCIETIDKYEDDFKDLWTDLGFSCDWDYAYQTIDESSQKIAQLSFLDLLKKGRAYRKNAPVLYCSECETSIAQAEIDYKEKETWFSDITFKTDTEDLIISTTRPELLYSCVCLFAHPEDKRYKHLEGKSCRVPLFNFEVDILLDEGVDMDKGTGLVMCSTFGDLQDLEWYKAYDFDFKESIGHDGKMMDHIPYIGGLDVTRARKTMIAKLEELGLSTSKKRIIHQTACHERCGAPIEILPSAQWYIDIMNHKDRLLQAADEINWYPSHMKNRYINWVENLKWDWCISRQRYFGVPFPLWYCQTCGQIMTVPAEDLPINPRESSPKEACSCGSRDFTPETDIMDTWATSSVTPLINAKWQSDEEIKEIMPMSMRTQAHEIIRTWTFYTIVKSIYHTGQVPWKDIMLCGFVLARKGEKISKSKGNAKSEPREILKRHSADSIRYWAASAKLGTDTTFSEEDLKVSKRFMTKLWNASKFSLSHLEDYAGPCDLLIQDQWMVDKSYEVLSRAKAYLDQYEIGLARQVLDDFFWKDFCDIYLELIKDRLYKPEVHGIEERQSGQHALYQILFNMLKAYAIFTPFITEDIYQAFFRGFEQTDSLHLCQWQTQPPQQHPLERLLKDLIHQVRKYRTDHDLSMKDPISIEFSHPQADLLRPIYKDLRAMLQADSFILRQGKNDLKIRIQGVK